MWGRRLVLGSVLMVLLVFSWTHRLEESRWGLIPQGIVIHHSASPPVLRTGVVDRDMIDLWHRRRGFRIETQGQVYHIGYHYVILPSGIIQVGRPEHVPGAHARGRNDYLGICLIGDYDVTSNPHGQHGPKDPPEAQLQALIRLITHLAEKYGFPTSHVITHGEVAHLTRCPGSRFPREYVLTEVATNLAPSSRPGLPGRAAHVFSWLIVLLAGGCVVAIVRQRHRQTKGGFWL
jgi:hypothetical protein